MRWDDDQILLSASDLMRFQGCAHATALDRRYLLGEDLQPIDDAASAELVQKKGDAHEAAYLERIQQSAAPVTVITTEDLSLTEAAKQTRQALLRGPAHIYQAAFKSGKWGGYADFLERVERPSKLGAFSYEVVDTKLKRSPDPKHLLQLGLYADLLTEIQGVAPERIHIELGNNERASFRLTDYASYARRLRRRLEAFVSAPQPTRPEPVASCGLCRWRDQCEQEWESADDLCLVAGIRRSQRRKLEAAGIVTVQQLAKCKTRVPKLASGTLDRLKVQAALQHARRQGGAPSFRVREAEAERGLTRLPKPDPGDLFFDMEGDPFVEGGLEYLFGIYHEAAGKPSFTDIWAHDREQEGRSTAKVLALFEDHLRKHPGAHIYHYAQYEMTALKRLASYHSIGEMALDRLLRARKFVDLFRVVQQGVVASEPGYSLKDLEVFYRPARDGDVATAGDSIVAYEAFRETGDAGTLEQIRAYNETDCRSTKGLRDWLVRDVRPKDMPWWGSMTSEVTALTEAEKDHYEIEREMVRASLNRVKDSFGEKPAELLFELASFHRREDKPAWWAMFDRAERETEELVDDLDSLGGLQAMGPATRVKRSLVRQYRYPAQETKLREGSKARARIEGLASVTIEALDPDDLTVDVKFGPIAGSPPETLDLIPDGPIDNKPLRMAIGRVVADVAQQSHRYGAIEQLLQRQPPRGKGLKVRQPILVEGTDLISGVTNVIAGLRTSCLPIQGPPGTGKTYISSHAILALINAGKRVAVTSNSHKAIDNLLRAVADRAREKCVKLKAVKKVSGDDAGPNDELIEVTKSNDDPKLTEYPLVGGTAWLFSREELDQTFDYLFVDEAGQVSLANAVAMATCARNLVLVGDPMQLAQPIQGVHPGESGRSALEYILAGHATAPADRGIFLPVSRRMHPAVCRYISDIVYEGRLRSDPDTERQQINRPRSSEKALPSAGIGFIEVEHEGNSQSSPEEVEALARTYKTLLGSSFRDRDGKARTMSVDDILVVSPYNAQVNLLARHLPAGARVGTVDRFQGQEAPACLVSMATSSGEELPRDIAFLFSTNRLNVAVSRAQALAVVFTSSRLLDVACRTVEDMKLVNALCALHDYTTNSAICAGEATVLHGRGGDQGA